MIYDVNELHNSKIVNQCSTFNKWKELKSPILEQSKATFLEAVIFICESVAFLFLYNHKII